jgi:RNA polymerase sigma-54 factor
MLKNRQQLLIQQKLSPQAIQAQLLLALPNIALEQEIKKQLEENPVLDDEINSQNDFNTAEDLNLPESEFNNTSDINKQLNYTNSFPSYSSVPKIKNFSGTDEEKTDFIYNKLLKTKETPLEQIYKIGLNNDELIIAEEILGNLEDDGYLRISLEEIQQILNDKFSLHADINEIERVLRIVQNLDPPGIAARSLQECLSIQLNDLLEQYNERADTIHNFSVEDIKLAVKMINEHFDDFKLKHYEKLAKHLNIPIEKVNVLFEIIHKLDPTPGKKDTSADYIIPDFIITQYGDDILVDLADDSFPQIGINKYYLNLLKDKTQKKQTQEFIKEKINSANWFINAIKQRRLTMLKIMNAIVNRQKDFFLTKGEVLNPMLEKDIAEDVNMDISSVSRTISNKYCQTDFGIYPLKYFFSSSLKTSEGEDISNKTVMNKIRELINSENKSKPLSDDLIAKMLNQQGFNIARRTVAKYREKMKIPKANLRREII